MMDKPPLTDVVGGFCVRLIKTMKFNINACFLLRFARDKYLVYLYFYKRQPPARWVGFKLKVRIC